MALLQTSQITGSGDLLLPGGEINDTDSNLNIVGTNAVTLQTGGGTAISIPSGSTNVGIGTDNPDVNLHVHNSATNANSYMYLTSDASGSDRGSVFHIGVDKSGTPTWATISLKDDGILRIGTGGSSNPSQIVCNTDSSVTFGGDVNINTSGKGLYFAGSNSRIYFGTKRALEGNSSGTNLQIGEHYSALSFYGDATFAGDISITGGGNILNVGGGSASEVSEQIRLSYGASDYHSIKTIFNGSTSSGNRIAFDLEDSSGPANKRVLTLQGDGTSTFGGTVTINHSSPILSLHDTGTGNAMNQYIQFKDGNGDEKGWVGYGSTGDSDFGIMNNNGGSVKIYSAGAQALHLDTTQGATFTANVSANTLTVDGGGHSLCVKKVHQETGTFTGDVTVTCSSSDWKSVCYDIKVGAHDGGGHYAGAFYHNNGVTSHIQSISQSTGNLSGCSVSSSSQNFTFTIPITPSSITHPVVVVELTSGGGDALEASDITIDVD